MILLAHSHLTEVDGKDGVRAGACGVHLSAGGGAGQSAELQALQQLQHTHTLQRTFGYDFKVQTEEEKTMIRKGVNQQKRITVDAVLLDHFP